MYITRPKPKLILLLLIKGAAVLEATLERWFPGSEFAPHRWHIFCSSGAWKLTLLGLPIRCPMAMFWGRWATREVARHYATPDDTEAAPEASLSWRLPFPPDVEGELPRLLRRRLETIWRLCLT